MHEYLATFPAGCFPLVARQLKKHPLSELAIVSHDDSSVIFKSSFSQERLIEFRYFTNMYLLFDSPVSIPPEAIKGHYYRLMALSQGVPRRLHPDLRETWDRTFVDVFRLTPDAHRARNDFFLIQRKSGVSSMALRLPRAKFKRDLLSPGELRPELAHLLCLAAGLRAKHVIVDPFAGYGSIPLEAVRGFGCKKVIASDVMVLPKRHNNPEIDWHTADATELSFIPSESVDRVITDPPWGRYQKAQESLITLHETFVVELVRILKFGSVAVVLSGQESFSDLVKASKKLNIINHWDVLVSGQQATIYKLQKVQK